MNENSHIEQLSNHGFRSAETGGITTPYAQTIVQSQLRPENSDRLIAQRYRMLEYLGRDRLGDIYKALDEASAGHGGERYVAIQLLDAAFATDADFLGYLRRRVAALRSGAHPNVIEIQDFGRDGRVAYLIMELIEGASLRDVLDDALTLPLAETADMLRTIGDALRYLHAKGFLHGDLKPENVFVTFDHEVKLLDIVAMTPSSAAPCAVENMDSSTERGPDVRDDVYGLACLAYELLSGKHPFNRNSPLEAHRAELKLIPIDGLPAQAWQALATGLSLFREHRQPTVQRFLDEFGRDSAASLPAPPSSDSSEARRDFHQQRRAALARAQQTATSLESQRLGSQKPRRRAGGQLFLVAIGALAAITFLNYERLRDRTAELFWTVAQPKSVISVAGIRNSDEVLQIEQPPSAAQERAAEVFVPAADTAGAVSAGALPRSDEPENQSAADALTTNADAATVDITGDAFMLTPGIGFRQSLVTVSESQPAAQVVLERAGDTSGAASVTWWLSDNTAIAGEDYSNIGQRTETFAPGQNNLTLYIPIIGDVLPETRKSFYVYIGRYNRVENHLETFATAQVEIDDDD